MLTNPQIAIAVVVVAVITFVCRIAPFVLLRGRKDNALLAARDRRAMSGRYLVAVEAISHISWVTGTTIGALTGTVLASVVGERIELLGFVLTSLFVVLAIENWRNHPDIGVLCLGLVAGGIGLAMGGSAALLTALVTLAAGLVGLYTWRTRRPGAPGPQPRRRAG